MRFTKLQCEIIDHRLEMPDCIHEACEEFCEDAELDYDLGDFQLACIRVSRKIHHQDFKLITLTTLEQLCLEDALEGSTYCACAESGLSNGEISEAKMRGIQKSYDNAVEKLVGAFGS